MSWRAIEQVATAHGWHIDSRDTCTLLLTGERPEAYNAPRLLERYPHHVVAGCVVIAIPHRGWREPAREVLVLRPSSRPDPRAVFEDDEITLVANGALL